MSSKRDINNYEKNYVELPFENYQVLYRRKKVLEVLSRYQHKKILEIGCGMEPIFQYIDDYDTMIIVEPGKKFVENAYQLIGKLKDKRDIRVIHGLLEDVIDMITETKFDYIILSSLLHEVYEPDQFLKILSKLMDSNTVLHINVPNANSIHRLIALESGLIQDVTEKSVQQHRMQQNSTFTLESLTALCGQCDFQVIESGTYFPKFFTHSQMQKLLDEDIVSEDILEGIYRLEKYMPQYGSECYVQVKKKI